MFKFLNLKLLQELCQTDFFNLSLKLQLDVVFTSCVILLRSALNISFASFAGWFF